MPITLRDKVLGVIQVLNKRSKESFTQADIALLTSMAQQIAVAMENSRLYRRLEEKFELTEEELLKTQKELIRSERLAAVGNLVDGVAHEIRNPIMTIGGFAWRIKNVCNNNPKLLKYSDIILSATTRLERLVGQLHNFVRVQSATFEMDSIDQVAKKVFESFMPLAEKKGVTFSKKIDQDIPLVELDAQQFITGLSNILENSFESLPEKGGSVELNISKNSDTIVIEVKDTGSGISEKQMSSVFDPFVTSKTSGAGLGLSMIHQIVVNHHGKISMQSQISEGTTVTIRLPIKPN